MKATISYFTHKGMKNNENYDALLVNDRVIRGNMEKIESCKEEAKLFAVSDGIGNNRYSGNASLEILKKLREKSFSISNLYAIQEELEFESYIKRFKQGAGATLSGIYFKENIAKIFHVGDSRVYHIRNGKVTQLTTDHTQANMLLHGDKNNLASIYSILMNYYVFGENEEFFVETKEINIQKGDRFFICSDGVVEIIKPIEENLLNFKKSEFAVFDSSDDFSFIYIEV